MGGMPPAARAIAWGGLTVGILDGLDATLFYRASALRIGQSIAAGLLGRDAFQGGWGASALGWSCHLLIATTATAVYWIASRKLALLTRQAIVCGLAYGVAVFFFMQHAVIPLSLIKRAAMPLPAFLNGVIGHALLVGLPIALITRHYSAIEKPAPERIAPIE